MLVAMSATGGLTLWADDADVQADTIFDRKDLEEVIVSTRVRGIGKMSGSAQNADMISSAELKRAACCSLGESFTTNPSVDVSYNDAATGARQIRLLGLSGRYVQVLTENIPNLRGAAGSYGLGYIPGPWMQSIQLSKGASSVKNGYESVTGQINVEMLKPQAEPSVAANLYADHLGKVEANLAGNIHLNGRLSTGLLLHADNSFAAHDENHDAFADSPKIRQLSAMNRWAWIGDNYVFQAGVKFLDEQRKSGQIVDHAHGTVGPEGLSEPYLTGIDTRRWEAFVKQACFFDKEHDGNVALILSGSSHEQNSMYGHKFYDVNQQNLYASLMFERKFGERHALSTGLSFNYDRYDQQFRLSHDEAAAAAKSIESENVEGAYAQYTLNMENRLIAMAGVRYDWSSVYGSMFTPRVHIKWNVMPQLSIYGSAGKGYKSTHPYADYSYLLASSRQITVDRHLAQEEAWNTGGGTSGSAYLLDRLMTWNAEYYYTDFVHQTVADLDSDPGAAYIKNLPGRSFSHAIQVELSCQLLPDLSLSAAYRYTDVKVDYGHGLVDKPLTSKSKGLFSASYAPMMGKWQFDATLAINGGGRLPDPYGSYKPFPVLNAQVSRNFRHWTVYLGGENLTSYRQKHPVAGASDPWGAGFDATMIYAPVHGAMVYAGFRYTFTKY